MANDRQYKSHTVLVGARGVKEYRATIEQYVRPTDVVLEIGCEHGTTTEVLEKACREVIGTDVSADCVAEARRRFPHIRFEVMDGFDVRAALELGKAFTKVYIDVSGMSGYRSLLDVIALCQMYATVLRPEAIVVKSGALKHFAYHCKAWEPHRPRSES